MNYIKKYLKEREVVVEVVVFKKYNLNKIFRFRKRFYKGRGERK